MFRIYSCRRLCELRLIWLRCSCGSLGFAVWAERSTVQSCANVRKLKGQNEHGHE